MYSKEMFLKSEKISKKIKKMQLLVAFLSCIFGLFILVLSGTTLCNFSPIQRFVFCTQNRTHFPGRLLLYSIRLVQYRLQCSYVSHRKLKNSILVGSVLVHPAKDPLLMNFLKSYNSTRFQQMIANAMLQCLH